MTAMRRRARARRSCDHAHRGHGLHKVLFVWLVVAIVATAASVTLVYRAFGGDRWRAPMEAIERFAVGRFEAAWDDPAAREELARAAERDLGVRVTLLDPLGHTLRSGDACDGYTHALAIDGRGVAQICIPHHRPSGSRLVLTLLTALLVLGALSGALARRLARPIRRVAAVAERLGEGELDARVGPMRARGEVALLAETIDRMADRVEQQVRDQKELLAAVSHELRTPLGHVRVLLELAREGQLDAGAVDELEREVVEMDRLVGELLARSRLDFETVDARELDARDLARRALERLGLPEARLDAPAPVTLDGDATLLARALANLLENAERHGRGLARLGVLRAAGEVRFEIDDHGEGFDEAAFEPFVRGDDRGARGLGLGLALVRRIARAHGGDVFVEPLPVGARIVLTVASDAADVGVHGVP